MNTIPTTPDDYVEHYVLFVDILGFQKIVEDRIMGPGEIQSMLDTVEMFSNKMFMGANEELAKFSENIDPYKIEHFSDSIIVAIPTCRLINDKSVHQYQNLLWIYFFARALQQMFCLHEILTRGGITLGGVFSDDKRIFGPAINQAYRLEQAASTPRIIVDQAVIEKLNFYDIKYFKKDVDGWWYIDYLKADNDYILKRIVPACKRVLEKHKDTEDLSLKTKYGWLKNKLEETLVFTPIDNP